MSFALAPFACDVGRARADCGRMRCLITSDFLAVNELQGIATKIAGNATMPA
jgi:hypothetical protein